MTNTNIENIKRDAYLKALAFKNTGLDEEAIYARLEKQGFPDEIAKEVAKNVVRHKHDLASEPSFNPSLPFNRSNVMGQLLGRFWFEIEQWFNKK